MLKIIKVTGHSMFPAYHDGDFVLISRAGRNIKQFHVGDDIIFDHELYGTMIKRIGRIDIAENRIFVQAEKDDSLDSSKIGWIDAGCVQGKVIWHVKP